MPIPNPDLVLYHGTTARSWAHKPAFAEYLYLTSHIGLAIASAHDTADGEAENGLKTAPILLRTTLARVLDLAAKMGWVLHPDYGEAQAQAQAMTWRECLDCKGAFAIEGDVNALKKAMERTTLDPNDRLALPATWD